MDIIGKGNMVYHTISNNNSRFLIYNFSGNFGLDFQGGTLWNSVLTNMFPMKKLEISFRLGFTQRRLFNSLKRKGSWCPDQTKELTPQEINQIETALKRRISFC